MKAISIFCGASYNGDPVLKQAVDLMADVMVSQDITLVFGGGRIGVMGIMADAVLHRGGKVIGVMPRFLMEKEIGHSGLTELHIVENMHQRKQMMSDFSDGFIMLPGGFGTLEEFFEVLTWLQLGLHPYPIGILNVNGFYDMLLKQLDVMVEQGYLKPDNRKLVITSADATELISLMNEVHINPDDVWFRDRNLS